MKVLYIPQNNNNVMFEYEFIKEKVIVTESSISYIDDIKYEMDDGDLISTPIKVKQVEFRMKDEFDFTGISDGDLIENIESTLTINPICNATFDGELKLELLNLYTKLEECDEILYPEWVVI